MNYKDVASKLGLDAAEKFLMELLIPYIDEVIQKSENKVDDMAWASLRGSLMKIIDKLDGEQDLPE